jgi:hypothetical protein
MATVVELLGNVSLGTIGIVVTSEATIVIVRRHGSSSFAALSSNRSLLAQWLVSVLPADESVFFAREAIRLSRLDIALADDGRCCSCCLLPQSTGRGGHHRFDMNGFATKQKQTKRVENMLLVAHDENSMNHEYDDLDQYVRSYHHRRQ